MFATAPREVREWLSEFKALKDEHVHTYAQTVRQRHALVDQLTTLLEEGLGGQWLEPVCHQLYDFFKSANTELRRFTLDLLPVMVWVYLSAVSRGEKRKCSGLEACLLGIYNLEIVGTDGKPSTRKYTIPTLAAPSIYHEPPSLATLAFTESALMRFQNDQPITVTTATKPAYSSITAQNRLHVMTHVMSVYNDEIGHMSAKSHGYYCKLCSRLCQSGFEHMDELQTGLVPINLNDSLSSASSRGSKRSVSFSHSHPRVPLTGDFLVELLSGLYFAMFNGHARQGIEALERVHTRASYELFANVLLVTNAIRNSLQANPSGQPQDGPMGISIALSPAQRHATLSKHAITNASFRAKRLPEDIDIVNDDEGENPPQYHDVIDTDRSDKSTSSAHAGTSQSAASGEKSKSKLSQMSNQVKSIMKKTSLKEDKKVARKESESKRRSGNFSETNSPKSPKHSTSAYSDIADPMQVQVAVSSARGSIVDKVDMSSLPSQNSIPSYASSTRSSHKRSPSYEEKPAYFTEDSRDFPDAIPMESPQYSRTNSLGFPTKEDDSAKVNLDLLESNKMLEKVQTNGLHLNDSHNSSSGSLNTAL